MVQSNAFDMELLSVEKYWDKKQAFITEPKHISVNCYQLTFHRHSYLPCMWLGPT